MAHAERKDKPPFTVRAGTGEHGLAYCLIRNQDARTPWIGDDDAFGVMRWRTVDHVIDLRAHGLTERDVIRNARRFVADWFATGTAPKFGNPAVRVLAHIDDAYPLTGKTRLISILTGRGYPKADAARLIDDAVRDGLIAARRGRHGIEYRLAHEPHTRAIADLSERVTQMMPRHPFGIPWRRLCHAAGTIARGGIFRGAALIERALNAGVIRAEVRGEGWRRERYVFPNFKTKGGKSC